MCRALPPSAQDSLGISVFLPSGCMGRSCPLQSSDWPRIKTATPPHRSLRLSRSNGDGRNKIMPRPSRGASPLQVSSHKKPHGWNRLAFLFPMFLCLGHVPGPSMKPTTHPLPAGQACRSRPSGRPVLIGRHCGPCGASSCMNPPGPAPYGTPAATFGERPNCAHLTSWIAPAKQPPSRPAQSIDCTSSGTALHFDRLSRPLAAPEPFGGRGFPARPPGPFCSVSMRTSRSRWS